MWNKAEAVGREEREQIEGMSEAECIGTGDRRDGERES